MPEMPKTKMPNKKTKCQKIKVLNFFKKIKRQTKTGKMGNQRKSDQKPKVSRNKMEIRIFLLK